MQKKFYKGKYYFVDTVLLGIMTLFSVSGCFRGLVKSMFCLISFFIAIVLSFYIAKNFTPVLTEKSFLKTPIEYAVVESLGNIDQRLIQQEFESTELMIELVESLDCQSFYKESINKYLYNIETNGLFTVKDVIVPKAYSRVVSILLFLISLFIIYSLLKIVQCFVTALIRIHYLKFTNRVAGFIFGTIFGGVTCVLVVCLLGLIAKNLFIFDLQMAIDSGEFGGVIFNTFIGKAEWLLNSVV